MATKTFQNVKLNVTFTKASDHLSNIASGNIADSLGKIAKWYDDFHEVVWTGNAATVNGKTVEANVPANAKFTDTTYGVFSTTANGLVPKPTAAQAGLFLNGAGEWAAPEVPEYSAAGTALGLVKTGGDVTITDGVITVNDDSHNHTISNVDGLQAALDAKVPTSRTVNGKALTTDITLDAAAVGADAAGSAAQALADAKDYTDEKIDALVGEGASETLDTIGEISKAIEDHQDVTDALNAAIGNKADKSTVTQLSTDLSEHIADKENPHGVTKDQIGLGKVENKSAADILGQLKAGTGITITPAADSSTFTISSRTYSNATASAAGLMSAAHYTKLEGIAAGAEVNQNAWSKITVGETTVSADAKEDTFEIKGGTNVTVSATGNVITIASNDTTYNVFTTSANGLVPMSGTASDTSFLASNGKWNSKPVVEEDTLVLNCVAG